VIFTGKLSQETLVSISIVVDRGTYGKLYSTEVLYQRLDYQPLDGSETDFVKNRIKKLSGVYHPTVKVSFGLGLGLRQRSRVVWANTQNDAI